MGITQEYKVIKSTGIIYLQMLTAMFLAHFDDGELVKRRAPTSKHEGMTWIGRQSRSSSNGAAYFDNENFDQQHQPHPYNNHNNNKHFTAAQTQNDLINRWFRVED